jgi:hypothetical protein
MPKLNFDFSSSLFSWFREDFERDDSGSFCDVFHVLESVFTIRSIVEIWPSNELNFLEVQLTMALLGIRATIEENSSATTNSLPAQSLWSLEELRLQPFPTRIAPSETRVIVVRLRNIQVSQNWGRKTILTAW